MRIVIVDDESLIRMDLRGILEDLGHIVVGEGQNGIEALQLVELHHPDIVLMDVKMPELDGIEAARQLRYKVPVVLLTAYSQAELVKKASESGVYGYLIKPLREVELEPALMMALGRYKEEQILVNKQKKLEQTVEERKVIAQAVKIVMEKKNIPESQAYKSLRKYSMERRIPIFEAAQAIVKSQKK